MGESRACTHQESETPGSFFVRRRTLSVQQGAGTGHERILPIIFAPAPEFTGVIGSASGYGGQGNDKR